MLDDIREIRKTNSEKEVNFLLSEGWKLINMVFLGSQAQYWLIRK